MPQPIRLRTPAELSAYTQVDPELKEILSVLPRPKHDLEHPEETILKIRKNWSSLSPPDPDPAVTETKSTYTTRDGVSQRILTFRPASASPDERLPVMVWYHGGGMCIGSPEMETSKCRQWCLDHRLLILAPAHRLAPEHKFPVGRDDCWDAFRHVVHHASALHADLSRGLLLGGESAGATVASTIALQARDDISLQSQGVKVTGVFLSAGSYINPLSPPPVYRPYYLSKTNPTCLTAPFLSGDTVKLFGHCYAAEETSPFLRASLWPKGLGELPKTYPQACGMDVNRDDGIVYAEMLAKAGVEARLDVYEGCPHCFWFLLGETRMGRRWARETKEGLGWLLGRR